MSTKSNKKAFINGLRIAKEKIHHFLIGRLAEYGEVLLADAAFQKGYKSFTGNTLTSLAFGVYKNTVLTDAVFISGKDAPVHAKIENGKRLYLKNPYEGEPRVRYGYVDIADEWGDETSLRTLKNVCPKGGNGIVVTTGTEYSTFLENVWDMNVLSDTFLYAENDALRDMKRWIKNDVPIDKL